MTRHALALLCVLALGACTGRDAAPLADGGRFVSLDAALARSPAETAPTPVAILPDWIGRPRSVRERGASEGFEQSVTLSSEAPGSGANLVLVAAGRVDGGGLDTLVVGGDAPAPMSRPTEAGIRAEIEAAFPGIAMQVVTRPAANAYGPYGLAIGKGTGGARCLYAWQWIDEGAAALGQTMPVSLRVRLCRADVTLEAMAAAVNELRLVPRGRGVATVARTGDRTRRVVRRRRHRTVAQAAVEVAQRRAATVSGSERRYLADLPDSGPPARSAQGAVPAIPAVRAPLAVPTTTGSLALDLPPEAFRGPARSGRAAP